MSELDGRHAVVTGAGSGIGAAVATALAGTGMRLSLFGRDPGKLERVAGALADARPVAVDVGDEAAVARGFDAARAACGPVSVLVNAAGAAESAPAHRTDLDLWQRMLDVNLTGTFLCARAALADMRAAKAGRIVNVASTAGLKGYRYVAAYCAAKHGVVGFTRALALETATLGITVNAVCPGYTRTPLLEGALDNIVASTGMSRDEACAELASVSPQARLVEPDEVARTVLWLCSPASGAMTGQSIAVAGGEVM